MHGTKILLVEDHPDDAFLTLLSLRKMKLEDVVVMDEAGKALEYLASQAEGDTGSLPDLIIVDLKLPKMDGFELIEEIRRKTETRDIPVAVLSSSVYVREKERCQELGVSAFFSKPLEVDSFIEFISSCTGKR